MSRRRTVWLLSAAALLGAAALAHVRLQNPGNGAKLRWAHSSAVGIVIASAGSDDIPSGLHFPALRNAIAAWNDAPGATVRLVEDASPAAEARTDWQDHGLHEIFFDETNASGYFPTGTGIVALTPVWFAGDGSIVDADVLFDGARYSFTTSGEPGRFDVQDVATHELGHFLGLDHSGWAGASMYPYVDPTVILHRSISQDEIHGMRDAYPAGGFASIAGTIRRQSDGTTVAGAHVVARDASGRTVAGALADRVGAFRLRGLDAGNYLVYATPLDSPVSVANLGAGNTVRTDFESTVIGTFTVSAGEALSIGDRTVAPDVTISLGRPSDAFPLRCVEGRTQYLSLRGLGLEPGSSLACSDPALTVVPVAWMSGGVSFQVTIPAGALPGHADLTATNASGDRSILPAALEITPPDPQVTSLSPSSGPAAGGTLVAITGTGFRAGARVVVGPSVYEDGQPGGCVVLDPTRIQLTTASTPGGTFDAVVIDPSGVEGRKVDGFQFTAQPAIASVFPPAGSASGGTHVVIEGSSFIEGCVVTIDGAPQGRVIFDDPGRVELVTDPATSAGPFTLQVENPGGGTASSAFAFAPAPDPSVSSLAPARGSSKGGEVVVLHGSNLPAGAVVVFGADPVSGLGGATATSVTRIDSGELDVVTPAHAHGTVSVLVSDPATGQAAILAGGFSFSRADGGGGGGCSVAPPDPDVSRLEPLAGGAWLLVLAGILLARELRARACRASRSA